MKYLTKGDPHWLLDILYLTVLKGNFILSVFIYC